MSLEAKEDEVIDLQALANQDEPEVKPVDDPGEELPELSATEQKAFDQGWRPKDDYQGDQDNWKSAGEYIRDGEFLATIGKLNSRLDKQEKDFDDRLNNSNKLHEARRKAEIKSLKQEQREAVKLSDTETYDAKQAEIDELEKVEVTDTTTTDTGKDPVVAAWEAKNPWINEAGNEKASVTTGIWTGFINQNPAATVQQALDHVDKRLAALYPVDTGNPRRDQPNTTETGRKAGKRGSKALTMNDLSADEKQQWQMFGQEMFTEAEFLKTVSDVRKG